ncbi:maleylacetoacetate isomerase [Acidocella aquatica]|uniref:Maleylacetoacetate isomerase n=1 Tax=Acidocella aquatica TaxID=1922313 RepID=A0ABQ6A701_9PROT|nr:maleylacetoacetate isomerase [Acidocella aquatica]GLR67063.1 maleylacetoacetate isomerase [Acidocella aquatica]
MNDKSRFELFAYWRTSATYRVRVALNLKGLTADERFVNLETGEQRSEAFLRINPLGAIPALIDREAQPAPPITQSLAILEFLEDIHPQTPLLPHTPHGRARVRSLASMLVADTHPLITPRVIKYLTDTAHFDADATRAWRANWLATGLQAFEQRLATEAETGTFCHGDRITIADICLASIKIVLPIFKIEVPDTPMVDRIFAACETHEAFMKAAPSRQFGAPA